MWKEGQVPVNWKEAITIPIREPGKDSTVQVETTKIQEYIRNMAPKDEVRREYLRQQKPNNDDDDEEAEEEGGQWTITEGQAWHVLTADIDEMADIKKSYH